MHFSFQAMTEVKRIPLKTRRTEVAEIDIKKCITCPIDTNESTCSNAQARMKILEAVEAARIRNDLVARRLQQVDHELFVYHVSNKWCKSYTLKTTLTKLDEKSSKATESQREMNRSKSHLLAEQPQPSTDISASEMICTVCGNI